VSVSIAGGSGGQTVADDPHDERRTPIMRAVALPPHMAWVPIDLWKVAGIAALFAGVAPGIPDGFTGEVYPEYMVATLAVLWPVFAYWYRRDPHVVNVWKARLAGRPVAPARGTSNVAQPRRQPGRLRFIA